MRIAGATSVSGCTGFQGEYCPSSCKVGGGTVSDVGCLLYAEGSAIECKGVGYVVGGVALVEGYLITGSIHTSPQSNGSVGYQLFQ